MLYPILAVVFGIAALVWSADRFVHGAASMAKNLGVSVFIIGLTVVALGTSAPEIVISTSAALSGSPDLAIGNAIGSNIANVGLILGITALIGSLPIHRQVIREDLPILIVITLVTGGLLFDRDLDQTDGIILVAMLAVYIYFLVKHKKTAEEPEGNEARLSETAEELEDESLTNIQASFYFVSGLIVLLGSAKLMVWGAQEIALSMGVSEAIIGLTLVALGTSLPELAAAVSSTLKGHHGLAIGNIIGSNIFNLLTVLPMPALLAPSALEATILTRDYALMLALTLILIILPFVGKRGHITALKGVFLLSLYVAYYVVLYQSQVASI
ncbi:MAG: calcium/sodium antiporter [Gammaproteobacteria bacterium]|nr:calcium/sodium antiporter [Gammaproteobacteria bacterium]